MQRASLSKFSAGRLSSLIKVCHLYSETTETPQTLDWAKFFLVEQKEDLLKQSINLSGLVSQL